MITAVQWFPVSDSSWVTSLNIMALSLSWLFFFQAEDGIRDVAVTGVQTCALPISLRRARVRRNPRTARAAGDPRAPPPRGRGGGVRAGHDDRTPRRGWPVAGARAHHAPPERTVPRRDARPRHHGGVGEGLGGGVGRPSSLAAFGTPNFCFSLSTNRCAIL